jgi:uncharacterized protein (DUF2147 family)
MTASLRSLLLSAATALGLALVTLQVSAQPASAHDPRGRWVAASGNLVVEIAPCGPQLCGTVVQVLGSRSMSRDGAEMAPVDTRPALGMTLLQGFTPTETGDAALPATEWDGKIYNRENGKTYRCKMSVTTATNAAGELVLHAYVGIPLFGSTQRWHRAAADAAAPAQQ